MRKIREVLRLKAEGCRNRLIAAAVGCALSTVQDCLRRCGEAGLAWPLPPEWTEEALYARLYRRQVPLSTKPAPDFACLHAELQRRGMTRLLLWQEYKAAQPDGWQYSEFCEQYRRWLGRQPAVLRQNHRPGDKLFVDYVRIPLMSVQHSGPSRPPIPVDAGRGFRSMPATDGAQATQQAATPTPNIQSYWFTYDADNRVDIDGGELLDGQIQVVARTGSVENEYDQAGNVVTQVSNGGAGYGIQTQTFSYDARGEQTGSVLTDGQVETRQYDADGRLVADVYHYAPGSWVLVSNPT